MNAFDWPDFSPSNCNPANGTTNRAGWMIRDTRETKLFFKSFGDGRVRRRARVASAATTYVSITHCNAIAVFLLDPSGFQDFLHSLHRLMSWWWWYKACAANTIFDLLLHIGLNRIRSVSWDGPSQCMGAVTVRIFYRYIHTKRITL